MLSPRAFMAANRSIFTAVPLRLVLLTSAHSNHGNSPAALSAYFIHPRGDDSAAESGVRLGDEPVGGIPRDVFEPGPELDGRKGTAEVEALSEITPQTSKRSTCSTNFDTLGADLFAQLMTEIDDRADDDERLGASAGHREAPVVPTVARAPAAP